MSIRTSVHLAVFVLFAALTTDVVVAQTREKGPWWPSPHGANDQAGNSNYITAEKILKALRIPKTGQTYELGRIYEAEMPQYGTVRTFSPSSGGRPPRKRVRVSRSRTTSPGSSARWARSSTPSVIKARPSAWRMAR